MKEHRREAILSLVILLVFLSLNISASTQNSEPMIKVGGLVQQSLALSYTRLTELPSTSLRAELYCVGGGPPILSGVWTGVELRQILKMAEPSPKAVKVALYADDGFTSDLSMEVANKDTTILAYELDGQRLVKADGTQSNRLVVPGRWGYKWVKDLDRIELVDYDFKGTYEQMGYSDEAIIDGLDIPTSSERSFATSTFIPSLGYSMVLIILLVPIALRLRKRAGEKQGVSLINPESEYRSDKC